MKYNYVYEMLCQNIFDITLEQQAKLGYRRESVRFYYPMASIRNLIFDNVKDDKDISEILQGFKNYMEKNYGKIDINISDERCCFVLSEEISEYVHTHKKGNEFILKLVDMLSTHSESEENIKKLFDEQGKDYQYQKIDNGEFDEMYHFTSGNDRYFYCFKNEGCHITYHRFLPEDYMELF